MKTAIKTNYLAKPSLHSLSVALTSAFLLGVTALPSKAAITSFDLSQFADYTQTSNAQPDSGSFNAFQFFPTITYTDGEDFTNASVSYNGTRSPILLNDGFWWLSVAAPSDLAVTYPTLAELEAAFPDGTEYTYTINGGNLGDQSASLLSPPRTFVNDVPFLTGTTYNDLQGFDPSQPFTITFNRTSSPNLSKSFRIFGTVWEVGYFPRPAYRYFVAEPVFEAFLNPTDTTITLPANTLDSGTFYGFELQYVENETNSNTGFNGASSLINFVTSTTGAFVTGSVIGSTPENPFLPTPDPGNNNGGFSFVDIPVTGGGMRFFDPDVAVGYDYSVTGGPLFASVLIPSALPNGDSNFTLELPGLGNFPLISGTPFDLLTLNPLGFNNFSITGIDTSEMLDPTNPLAFVTGLSFTNNGTVSVTQTPIVENIPDNVSTPEPSSLLGFGLLGLGFGLKKLKK